MTFSLFVELSTTACSEATASVILSSLSGVSKPRIHPSARFVLLNFFIGPGHPRLTPGIYPGHPRNIVGVACHLVASLMGCSGPLPKPCPLFFLPLSTSALRSFFPTWLISIYFPSPNIYLLQHCCPTSKRPYNLSSENDL
jgi:hypothetical protein